MVIVCCPYNFFSFFRTIKWIVKSIKNLIFDTSFFSLLIKASEVTKDICAVHGEDAIAERTFRDWFTRFKHSNYDLNGAWHNKVVQPKKTDRQGLVSLLHDNAWRHTAKTVKVALEGLGWEVLQRSPMQQPNRKRKICLIFHKKGWHIVLS